MNRFQKLITSNHNTFFYFPDLPSPPQSLLSGWRTWNHQPLRYDGVGATRQIQKQGIVIDNAKYRKYPLPPDLQNWIDTNISDAHCDSGISFAQGSSEQIPHTDHYRDFNLYYLLDTGGETVITSMYQILGQEIIQPRNTWPTDYDSITKIAAIEIPLHKWVLLDGRVVHGVEGITGTRVQLTLSFDHFPNLFDR